MRHYIHDIIFKIEETDERCKKTLEECTRLEQKLALSNKDKQLNEKKVTQVGKYW